MADVEWEYAAMLDDGSIVGLGPTDLSHALSDAAAWCRDGEHARVVRRPVAAWVSYDDIEWVPRGTLAYDVARLRVAWRVAAAPTWDVMRVLVERVDRAVHSRAPRETGRLRRF